MNKIKVGDWVTVDATAYIDITENKKYKVDEVGADYVVIIDDVNDVGLCKLKDVTLASKTTPRPHAELIKLWADDDKMEIEYWDGEDWDVIKTPAWHHHTDYREKPSEPTERDLIMKEIQEAQDKLNAAKKRLEGIE